jgi:hypothetical protein
MDTEIDLRDLNLKTPVFERQSSVELEKHLFTILEQRFLFYIHEIIQLSLDSCR